MAFYWDIGTIRHPYLAQLRWGKLPVEHIVCNRILVIRIRGSHKLLARTACHAHLLHKPCHIGSGQCNAHLMELYGYFLTTIDLSAIGKHLLYLFFKDRSEERRVGKERRIRCG